MTSTRFLVSVLVLLTNTIGEKICLPRSEYQCSGDYSSSSSACNCVPDVTNRELCCDFNGKSGSIGENVVMFFSEVFVINAKTIEFHPECAREQNITFINIEHGAFLRVEGSLVYAKDVSINGEIVPNFLNSDYVRMTPPQRFQLVSPRDILCQGNMTELKCNLAPYRSLIVNLTIALEGPSNMTTFKDGIINEVYNNGISIIRGVLVLDHVVIRHLEPGAINVEKDGKIMIAAPTHGENIGCSSLGPSIIVDSRSQVVFIGTQTPAWLWFCTKIRPNATFTDKIQPGFVILHPKLCYLDPVARQFTCNIFNEEGAIFGGNNYFDDVHSVTIHTGRHLVVREHCLYEMLVESVLQVTFDRTENSCFHKLVIVNSTVDNLWNNVISFNVSNSKITNLIPSANVSEAILQASHVSTMRITVRVGNFRDVTFHAIESLIVQNNLYINNTILWTILGSSITVQKTGVLSINQCSVEILNIRSIMVYGRLEITSTVIQKAFNTSIVVHPDAFIRMDNVTIASYVPHLFIMEGQKSFELESLKVNFEDLHIIQMLTLVKEKNRTNSNTSVAQYIESVDRSSENMGLITENEITASKPLASGSQSKSTMDPKTIGTEESPDTTPSTSSKAPGEIDLLEPTTVKQDEFNRNTSEPLEEVIPINAAKMVNSQTGMSMSEEIMSEKSKKEDGNERGMEAVVFYISFGVTVIVFSVFLCAKCKKSSNNPVGGCKTQTSQVSFDAASGLQVKLLVKEFTSFWTAQSAVRLQKFSVKAPLLSSSPSFGVLFDIDGVLVRGRKVLPTAPKAFAKLLDEHGRFRVPTVFVTNAGNALRNEKAEQLSSWLHADIDEDQVIMAHSPLKLFEHFMGKHILVSGQGPVCEIAYNLGFRNITTIEELRQAYPQLDCVDQKRRHLQPPSDGRRIAPIEGLMLFGEPVRWETSLQLLLDVLMTGGNVEGPP
ncbi:HAD-superfamily hydrolase subfamily IIA, partial [Trinorchestia longiramus]